MTPDPLADLAPAALDAAATGDPGLFARWARVVAAQLDAGKAACRFVAAAGHQGAHRNCRACGVLRDAQVAGLWSPDASEAPHGRRGEGTLRPSPRVPDGRRAPEAPDDPPRGRSGPHGATETVRRACACGASSTFEGAPEIAARLAARWDADHDGPGHGPTRQSPSQDGRAPRRPR